MKFRYNLGIVQVLLIDVLVFDLNLIALALLLHGTLTAILGITVGLFIGLLLLIDFNYQLIRYKRGK